MGIIYLARNDINGKGYVGKTIGSLESRRLLHEQYAANGEMWAFACAIRKYGWDSFEWSILYQDDDNDREWMDWWERKFIRQLGTKVPNGYNMTDGGDGGSVPITEEGRRKLSEARVLYWSDENNRKSLSLALSGRPKPDGFGEKLRLANLGKQHTPETRKKMSDAKKGTHRVFSEEHKLHISESAKKRGVSKEVLEKFMAAGLASPNRGMIGKKHSEESKRKMSESAKKRWARESGQNTEVDDIDENE